MKNFYLVSVIFLLLINRQVIANPTDSSMLESLLKIQHEWAQIHYETPENQQAQAYQKLLTNAHSLSETYNQKAEPLVWEGIVSSSLAGVLSGLEPLSYAKQARELLLKAEQLDPDALDGSIYTSLGVLYQKVPGWPIGFGDDDLAKATLEKALAINPDGIDPNFFYGDYLSEEGEYDAALRYYNKALQAKPRVNRPLADKGRQKEIRLAIKKTEEASKSTFKW